MAVLDVEHQAMQTAALVALIQEQNPRADFFELDTNSGSSEISIWQALIQQGDHLLKLLRDELDRYVRITIRSRFHAKKR